jgi:hypothetical protein
MCDEEPFDYEKVRQGGRIVSLAAVAAVGVRDTGEKSVLGLAVAALVRTYCPQAPAARSIA